MKKKWLLIIPIVGIVILYLIYRARKGSGGGASADSSAGLPGVIVTGGGSYIPSGLNSAPPIQTFDNSTWNLPTNTGSSGTMAPNPAASGVPGYTAQAQEFNTAPAVPAPHPDNAAPSFYNTSAPTLADLPYQQLAPQYVAPTIEGASPNPTLQSFLQQDIRSYEVDASFAVGNNAQLGTQPRTAADIQATLGGEAAGYCGLHPEACKGVDQTTLISSLTNAYSDFVTQAQQVPTGTQPLGNLPGGGSLPAGGVAPSGPITMHIDPTTGQAVFLAANQLPPTIDQTTTPTTTSDATAQKAAARRITPGWIVG